MHDIDPSRSLWSNTGRSRFFLIPDDQQPPPGDFVIRTLTGRKLTVDPAALAQYEVSEGQAKRWLESEFEDILDGARGAVDRFVDKLRGGDADRVAPLRSAVEDLGKTFERLVKSGPLTPAEKSELQALAGRLSAIETKMSSI